MLLVPSAEVFPCYTESAFYICDDGNAYNGYWWRTIWVPGMVSMNTWFTPTPPLVFGYSTFYGPYAMKATADYRGMKYQENYVGMVSGIFCADIGNQVWLKRPNKDWEGPFLIVDCARQNDLYGVIVSYGEVVEVDHETAIRWGMVDRYTDEVYLWKQFVLMSKVPPEEQYEYTPIYLRSWFLNMVEYATHNERDYTIIYQYPSTWRINKDWITFPNNLPGPKHEPSYCWGEICIR